MHDEATRRGYRFDRRKIGRPGAARLRVTAGQLAYEWSHLKAKLAVRDRARLVALRRIARPDVHPLFRIARGPVEAWERAGGRRGAR